MAETGLGLLAPVLNGPIVEVIKTITDQDGNSTTAKFYLYHFMLPLRHGLAKNYQILPANVHLRLTFHRADAKKGLNINY